MQAMWASNEHLTCPLTTPLLSNSSAAMANEHPGMSALICHLVYYFPGGDCVILVRIWSYLMSLVVLTTVLDKLSQSQTLYCLHKEYLQLNIGCFQTLLSICPSSPLEGADDSHLIMIPANPVKDFNHFLDYLLCQWVSPLTHPSRLTSENWWRTWSPHS